MNAKKKKILIILCGCAAAILIALVVFIMTFDINSHRSGIETAASGATGLEVKIKGKMGLSLFPVGVSAKDVHVSNKGNEIISVETLKLGVELLPLLRKQLKVTDSELVKPVFTIVQDVNGKYNFEGPEKKSAGGAPGAAFSLKKLKLTGGVLAYTDMKTGEKTGFNDFNLELGGLSTGDASGDILKKISFTIRFDCKEALQKDFRIGNLKATVKAEKGTYNFDPLTIGELVYFDRKAGEKTELKEISLDVKDLSVLGTSGEIMNNIAFTGDMACKEVRKKNLILENIRSPVKVEKGVIYLTSLTMDIFGAKAEGNATADKSKAEAVYKIDVKVSQLDFAKLQESFGSKKVIGGKGDLEASLTVVEKGSRKLIRGLEGAISIQGANLVTYTMDLDKILTAYDESQNINLVDLGAYFIAGPLSSIALKGYQYGDVYHHSQGGQGSISQFISHWKIKGGVANAVDCALSTRHNRIALKGKLNFVSERYENVIVALLDDKGCAKYRQGISGPFGHPQVSSVSVVESLATPIFSLYRKTSRFIQGGNCEVFYKGAVRQPR